MIDRMFELAVENGEGKRLVFYFGDARKAAEVEGAALARGFKVEPKAIGLHDDVPYAIKAMEVFLT